MENQFFLVKHAKREVHPSGRIAFKVYLSNGQIISRIIHKKPAPLGMTELGDHFDFKKSKYTRADIDQQYFSYFDNQRINDHIHFKILSNTLDLSDFNNVFICTKIINTQHGYHFGLLVSSNVINDFELELINSKGGFFKSKYPIYEFLKSQKYTVNNDGTINLKKKYNDRYVDNKNQCFRKNINPNEYLSPENIQEIYQKFYSHKVHYGRTTETHYDIAEHGIISRHSREVSSMHTSQTSNYCFTFGQALSAEEKEYIATKIKNSLL